MSSNYAAPLLRAFRQAPWRTQTQAVAAWSIILMTVMVLGGFYLTVAARAATAGRDVQALEARKTELVQQSDTLRAELANLRSVARLEERARGLGFQAARPAQIEYLRISDYPYVETLPPPRASVAPPPPANSLDQLGQWLAHTLRGLISTLDTPQVAGAAS